MTPGAIEIRKEICGRCPTPCAEFITEKVRFSDGCAICPLTPPRWGAYDCGVETPFGLGDAVAKVAQPIARALDSVLGTKIQGCGGCKQRQAALNRILPKL